MKVKNTEHIAGRLTQINNCKGLSDAVIIEIVHGIKEIIIKLIDQVKEYNGYRGYEKDRRENIDKLL